jgi:hypothetical protein
MQIRAASSVATEHSDWEVALMDSDWPIIA